MLITWNDCVARYPELGSLRDATQADSSYVQYAIAELNAKLGPYFTVPFSDNNLTAKDLAIDLTFAKLYRFKDEKKSAAINSYIGQFMDELIAGRACMLTTSGDVIDSNGSAIYGTTTGYHPIFGVSRDILWEVDSGQIIDEESTRGRFY